MKEKERKNGKKKKHKRKKKRGKREVQREREKERGKKREGKGEREVIQLNVAEHVTDFPVPQVLEQNVKVVKRHQRTRATEHRRASCRRACLTGETR